LFEIIKEKALAIGIASICNKKIDLMGIGLANLLVMKMAIESLPFIPHYLLIDGERCRLAIAIPQKSFNDGDTKSTSIAAASIIAKITRDRIMVNYHRKYPVYEFPRHKGYGTKLHLRRLRKHGPSPIHRRSFSLARICRLKAEKVVQLELQPR